MKKIIFIIATLPILSFSQNCNRYDLRLDNVSNQWNNENWQFVEKEYKDILQSIESENCISKESYIHINLARFYSNFNLKEEALHHYSKAISLVDKFNPTDKRRLLVANETANFLMKHQAWEEALPLFKMEEKYYYLKNDIENFLSAKLVIISIFMEQEDWDSFQVEYDKLYDYKDKILSNSYLHKTYNVILLRYYMYVYKAEEAFKQLDILTNIYRKNNEINPYYLSTYHYFDIWSNEATKILDNNLIELTNKIQNDFSSLNTIKKREDYLYFFNKTFDYYNSYVLKNSIIENNITSKLIFVKNLAINSIINQNLDFNSVRNLKSYLKSNETIIIYNSFNFFNGLYIEDRVIYTALVLRKNWKEPKLVKLFEEQELKKVLSSASNNNLYDLRGGGTNTPTVNLDLYNLIIKPIQPFLNHGETIYISPSGMLNQISFAGISKDSTYLNHIYQIKRITSFGKTNSFNNKPSSIFLFGDIDYNAKTTSEYNIDNRTMLSAKSNNENGYWTYLPNSKTEIEKISSLAKKNYIKNTIYSRENASESAFKKLPQQSPEIIHIATHGFFYEYPFNKTNHLISTSDNFSFENNENPLLRSGLIMAGGNEAWVNQDQDGVLTAQEIANLNLNETKLVVLSACDTGLGDIIGYEGVFGLQRAFKMAGVKNIIMSLWKVSDEGTAIFMEIFYEFYFKTHNISYSLDQTKKYFQKKYREKEGEVDQILYSPDVWAAFVLIEG